MDESDVKRHWEDNADAWTILARKGYDIYRDYVNTPAFLKMLGHVRGMKGLDIGCGEGYNTRKIAGEGASMTGIDISERFIYYAQQQENENPLHINYTAGSCLKLPFDDEGFDFCVALMSLMDVPDHERAVSEVYRVLKKNGFFQFSIVHPCFATPKWKWLFDENKKKIALACGDYFKQLDGEIEEWIFSSAPQELKERFNKFKIPRFSRTLSSWLNILTDCGFTFEKFAEPSADVEAIKKFPHLADTTIIAYFLIVRCRKK